VLAVTLLVIGLCGGGVAARGVLAQLMPRRFTAAQQQQIQAWEVAGRWRRLPEMAIFPATAAYQVPSLTLDGSSSLPLAARRLGIGAPAGCAPGTDPDAARVLARYGCTSLLRATYADATQSMLVTVGVAVLPTAAAATAAQAQLAGQLQQGAPGVVAPAPVPGTLAASFDDAQRQVSWTGRAGPYVIMATAGYADGRPRVRLAADTYLFAEMTSLAQGLGGDVSGVLGPVPAVPTCPGAPGC
jgi:hypothetical protein